jgi:sulfatase modifying factor 1
MVWVAGGRFEMGDTTYPEEGPIRPTRVAGFWMDRTEVTNDEFAAFVQATGYVTVAERAVDAKQHPELPPEMRQPGAVVFAMPTAVSNRNDLRQWWQYVPGAQWRHPGGPATDIQQRGHFPVVTVTYEDAQAYARWKGRSLPTEAQWEWAARAGQPLASKDHDQPHGANTWQGVFPVKNSAEDGFVGLAPVGCYAPNAMGLFDMMGNVWEMTRDVFTPDHRKVVENPTDAPSDASPDPVIVRNAAAQQRVIKGGSFLCSPDYCMRYRSGSRQPQEEDLGTSHLGFRTVLQAPGP